MESLCRRCYVKRHPELKKKDVKQLISTTDKYQCSECGEYKTIVIERKPKENNYLSFYENDFEE